MDGEVLGETAILSQRAVTFNHLPALSPHFVEDDVGWWGLVGSAKRSALGRDYMKVGRIILLSIIYLYSLLYY